MTTHHRSATGRFTHRVHAVTGTATQLANLVENHRNAGTLVALSAPQPVADHRFRIDIKLREPAASTPAARAASGGPIRRRTGRAPTAVVVTAVTGTAAGLLAVAAYLIGQLVELIAAHAGPILAVLALTLAATVAARRRSGRRHCPGC